MASLSSHIPLATVVVMNSLYTRTFEIDPFTLSASLPKTGDGQPLSYQCITLKDESAGEVHHLRITD